MIFLKLGEILFNGSEVPESINGGGSQLEAVNQLIGGKRIVDTLGGSDDDVSWSGLFRGVLSLERVRYLDTLRKSGKQVSFSYSQFSYNVVVKDFKWNMKMAYQIYYSITLTIVEDLMRPVTVAIPISFSDVILGAYQEALDIATFIKDGGLLGALGLLGAALGNVPNIDNATISEITGISNAIANANNQVNSLINSL